MVDSLLPPNATAEERALEAAMARVENVPIPIKDLMDPWKCPKELLPFMAWAMSVDYWSPYWPENVQRKVYAAALKVHRIKGTEGAVVDALAALDLEATVSKWFEYAGTPGKFMVDINLTTRGLTEAEYSAATAVTLNAKNTRSHLDGLNISLTNKTAVPTFSCVMCSGESTTLYPMESPVINLMSSPHFACAMYAVETVTLNPQGVS